MKYKRVYVSGGEMTYQEFKEYVESYKSMFENQQKVLEKYETDDDILSLNFCIYYSAFLKDRLRYCHTCSTYYRAAAEKSFWFMKWRLLRIAKEFETIHRDTIEKLLIVRMFIKMQKYDAKEETK